MPDSPPYKLRVPLESAFDATIGFVVHDGNELDRCSGHLPVSPQVCQPLGMVHGGVYAAMAETLASTGTARGVFATGGGALGMAEHRLPVADHRGFRTWQGGGDTQGSDQLGLGRRDARRSAAALRNVTCHDCRAAPCRAALIRRHPTFAGTTSHSFVISSDPAPRRR